MMASPDRTETLAEPWDPWLDDALARATADLRTAADQVPLRPRHHRDGANRSSRPRRRLRLVLGSAVALLVLVAAGGVVYLRSQAGELRRVRVDGLVPIATGSPGSEPVHTAAAPTDSQVTASDPTGSTTPAAPASTVPVLASAVNVLVVGVDTRDDGSVPGTRPDTIAVVRLDPTAGRVAVLSIPRDLWVTPPGVAARGGRINALLTDPGDPSTLVATISDTFGLELHHYVAIDFAGFRELVDLAGGVVVPFDAAVRDTHTGFTAEPGCQRLDGDAALAYVRSRYLQRFDPAAGQWLLDPRSDLGRIARQQDLVRRLYTAVLAADYGITDELRILTDVVDDVIVDEGLDLRALRSLFATARAIGAGGFVTYHLADAVRASVIDGNSVLEPTESVAAVVADFLHGDAASTPTPAPAGAIVPTEAPGC